MIGASGSLEAKGQGMADRPEPERRSSPRFTTFHPIEGGFLGQQEIQFRGTLCDISLLGCRLRLDRHIPQGSPIQAFCDINGIGLQIRGKIVWVKLADGSTLHGVLMTGFPSDEDAQFQRLYLRRLAAHPPDRPPSK